MMNKELNELKFIITNLLETLECPPVPFDNKHNNEIYFECVGNTYIQILEVINEVEDKYLNCRKCKSIMLYIKTVSVNNNETKQLLGIREDYKCSNEACGRIQSTLIPKE